MHWLVVTEFLGNIGPASPMTVVQRPFAAFLAEWLLVLQSTTGLMAM